MDVIPARAGLFFRTGGICGRPRRRLSSGILPHFHGPGNKSRLSTYVFIARTRRGPSPEGEGGANTMELPARLFALVRILHPTGILFSARAQRARTRRSAHHRGPGFPRATRRDVELRSAIGGVGVFIAVGCYRHGYNGNDACADTSTIARSGSKNAQRPLSRRRVRVRRYCAEAHPVRMRTSIQCVPCGAYLRSRGLVFLRVDCIPFSHACLGALYSVSFCCPTPGVTSRVAASSAGFWKTATLPGQPAELCCRSPESTREAGGPANLASTAKRQHRPFARTRSRGS